MKLFCDLHGKSLFVVLYDASYANQGKHTQVLHHDRRFNKTVSGDKMNLKLINETNFSKSKAKTKMNGSVKEPNILIYFFFPPITRSCSVSDVLFTGGRGVSDFSLSKYY